MTAEQASARKEWREGWGLVLACTIGFSFFSITTVAMSVFMGPMGEELGFGRTLLSAGLTISSVVTGLLSPPFGVLIDRFGSRQLALPGLVITALVIAGIGLAGPSALWWLLMWAFYATVSISVKTTVWTSAITGAFSAGRGLALGMVLSGVALAQIVCPPLSHWLIGEFGWRMAWVWLGLGWGSVTLAACWFFLYDAHDRRPAAGEAKRERPGFPGLTVAQARRSKALWQIAAATFLLMLFALGLQIHQVQILVEAGVSRGNAAWLASLAGAAGIIGKLVTGMLLDHYRANWIGGLTFAALGLAFLMLTGSMAAPVLIVAGMAVNGYAAGTKLQICTYLTGRHAGLRSFGVIYGFMTSVVALGSGIGPLIAGAVHDVTGTYDMFLIAGIIGSAIAALLIFTMPAYPDWGDRPGDQAASA